jgi:hypothetical protein
MHLENRRRTSAELDDSSSRNTFHVNWFYLETADQLSLKQKAGFKYGPLYGSQNEIIGAASFTV